MIQAKASLQELHYSDLKNDQIESLSNCMGMLSKRQCVREVMDNVGFQLRKELILLLELASWKLKMVEVERGNSASKLAWDRESCRYQCGAEVVIENVTEYLWANNESNYCTALSVFPFFTTL